MTVLVIGDVRGEKIVFDVEDIQECIYSRGTKVPIYDKYIFMGNYINSDIITPYDANLNLSKLINFKKLYPNHVELLIGDKDLAYIFNKQDFEYNTKYDVYYEPIRRLFKHNIYNFTPAFQYENYIFTNAGINYKWFELFKEQFNVKDDYINCNIINEHFMNCYLTNNTDPLFFDKKLKGFLFCPIGYMIDSFIPNYHQFIGHTPVKETKTVYYNKAVPDSGSNTFLDVVLSSENVVDIYDIFKLN